jgi:hypothetical protein
MGGQQDFRRQAVSGKIFQKTDLGKAEISRRQAGLSMATRSVLIMVNGSDSVAALAARGIEQVQGHLDALLALRLIEPVADSRLRVKAVPEPVPASPAAARTSVPNVASPPATLPEPDLEPLRRRAMLLLTPHFGPDTPVVAQALLAARSVAAFNDALDAIQSKLSIYLGRKQAARELEDLRPPT